MQQFNKFTSVLQQCRALFLCGLTSVQPSKPTNHSESELVKKRKRKDGRYDKSRT
nr:MAG TPA: hypothetical protein [Caudoviricetes sp.]